MYNDRSAVGNSPQYHTGKPCIVAGCTRPAGTWWSPLWCVEHNIERIDRIDKRFSDLLTEWGSK